MINNNNNNNNKNNNNNNKIRNSHQGHCKYHSMFKNIIKNQ